ncbi:DSBA-like thioredoxin domain protein [Microbulbifer aggregans]|uniref:DSBA-like thioredoxin domain protein n=1 Tax=Microbulbifer aggregans TaxID=1769779 RepID=A0A1C9W4E6_9GAMM|nr:thioredoxin domain-containing protein [Microbulbifer aggregans]AOS96014.1 DSBA-like thioredoxin domain protein [Microbulbifer aggregans]
MDHRDSRPGRFNQLLLGLICSTLLTACASDEQDIGRPETKRDPVVARIGEDEITLAQVDRKIRLERHDLAHAEYQLRFNTLKSLVDGRLSSLASGEKAPTVDWLLTYPKPPRIKLETGGRPLRGNPAAPITIAVFCSYQSVHCAATNLVLRELLDRYAGWISVIPFDFPMHYHRQGVSAATAVHCAGLQGSPWLYADGLYTRAKALDEQVYTRLASQLGLAQTSFTQCLSEANAGDRVNEDTTLARALGLQSVPVIFINGLYIKGPRDIEHYAMWIEQELQHLGHDSARPHADADRWQLSGKVAETDLPLQLTGTSVSSQPEQSSALIRIQEAAVGRFTPGDTLMPAVILKRVHERYVILAVNGHLERLSLKGEDGEYVHVPRTGTTQRDEETLRRIEQPEGELRKLVDPSGVLPLGQAWLEKQLQNREALEQKFVQAEHVVDGHNLLRLEGIESNEFFTALGFEEGDVVVRVNDSWVHSGQNQLWDALTSGEVVDVTYMRNGMPERVQYVVQEKGYFEQPDDNGNSGNEDKTD